MSKPVSRVVLRPASGGDLDKEFKVKAIRLQPTKKPRSLRGWMVYKMSFSMLGAEKLFDVRSTGAGEMFWIVKTCARKTPVRLCSEEFVT